MSRRSIVSTSEGTHAEAFAGRDWLLLVTAAGIWGSSFLLIDIALEALAPSVITPGRILFGFCGLAVLPRSRQPIDRRDYPRIAVLGLTWMAFPLSLFPIAQQWIDSSVAGMLNASMPLMTALFASVLLRRAPGRAQATGLGIGFLGVLLISWPSLDAGSSTALGAGLVLLATCSYAVAANLVVPLSQKYDAAPLMLRVQIFGFVMVAPFGIVGLAHSRFDAGSIAAVVVLGVLGTGLAFVAASGLMARVGATRGSLITYLVPIVAIVLGVGLRDDTLHLVTVGGIALVLVGAWIASRAERPASITPPATDGGGGSVVAGSLP